VSTLCFKTDSSTEKVQALPASSVTFSDNGFRECVRGHRIHTPVCRARQATGWRKCSKCQYKEAL